jgi:hypothetical protein
MFDEALQYLLTTIEVKLPGAIIGAVATRNFNSDVAMYPQTLEAVETKYTGLVSIL